MKKVFAFILILSSLSFGVSAQTMKEYKVGHEFSLSMPDYLSKTIGLNSASSFQFKNVTKGIYGFIIEDSKDELALAQSNFSNATEFYDYFIKDFLVGEKKREVGKAQTKTVGGINFVEADVSYYDKEAKAEIYYFVGVVETKGYFYKFLCYTSLEDKGKFKADLQKMLYSIKD